MVKYGNGYDEQKGWFLQNDSLRHIEHPEAGAKRILEEQLGIENASLKLVEIESFIGNNKSWHLILDYVAKVSTTNFTKATGIEEAAWFEIDKLPGATDFAHHGWGRQVLLKYATSPN